MPADILQLIQGCCEEQFECDTEEEVQITCMCLHVQEHCFCCFNCLMVSRTAVSGVWMGGESVLTSEMWSGVGGQEHYLSPSWRKKQNPASASLTYWSGAALWLTPEQYWSRSMFYFICLSILRRAVPWLEQIRKVMNVNDLSISNLKWEISGNKGRYKDFSSNFLFVKKRHTSDT